MTTKEQFIEMAKGITRPGIDQMMAWLETTDFYTAPASTRFHGAEEGGLCAHSITVAKRLLEIADLWAPNQYSRDTLLTVALFHDLCKVFTYPVSTRNVKDKTTGRWKEVPYYDFKPKESVGGNNHGDLSCYRITATGIVFDFNGMKGSLLTMSMFVVLDFVWTKIKEDRTQRKAVFIDECWKLIGTDSNEQAAEDVVEIFRTIRAYGGSAFAMTQDISQFYEYKGGKYGKAIIGNADTKIIMHLIPSEAKALQEAIQLTSVEMEAVSSLPRGQGLVCSASAKLFVDFVADDYEAKEITTDAKSFYERRKALEKKKREEEEKAAENTVIDVEM